MGKIVFGLFMFWVIAYMFAGILDERASKEYRKMALDKLSIEGSLKDGFIIKNKGNKDINLRFYKISRYKTTLIDAFVLKKYKKVNLKGVSYIMLNNKEKIDISKLVTYQ